MPDFTGLAGLNLDGEALFTLLVIPTVPAFIAAVKARVPNWMLPILASVFGIALQFLSAVRENVDVNLILGTVLGITGLYAREVLKHWLPGKAREARLRAKRAGGRLPT